MLKTVSSITNAIGALNYKGVWNATTNVPALSSGVGTKGDYYVVSVAGATNLDGATLWGVGDWAVFNGAAWQKVEGGSTINATTGTFSGILTANGNIINGPTTAPAFSAYFAGAQSVTTGVATKVQINTEEFDTNSNFDSATNYRFTPTVAGYYQINGCVYPSTATTSTAVWIYKNGGSFKFASYPAANSSAFVSCVINFNGSTDYVELYVTLVGVTPALQTGVQYTAFSGALVRSI